MSTRVAGPGPPGLSGRSRPELAALVGMGVLLVLVALVAGGLAGEGILALGLAAAIGVAFLRKTSTALLLWMLAALARFSSPHPPGARELYELAFLALIAVYASEVVSGRRSFPRFGAVELLMGLYLAWLVGSALASHAYPADNPLTGEPWSAYFLIMNSTVMPFATFVIARNTIGVPGIAKRFLWLCVAFATYLSLTNVFEAAHLDALVFPKAVLTDPSWDGRAAGLFQQPVINGFAICCGIPTAILLASRRESSLAPRITALVCLATFGPGIFLTHTRAPLLAAGLILFVGVVLARGTARTLYAAAIGVVFAAIAVNWSTFTSSDRSAGGVGQVSEVESRLNGIATSVAAIRDEPWFGFGLGRFQQVSVHRHEAWGSTTWYHGYGEISHETELGIAVELGLVGLALWFAVLIGVGVITRRAWKALPSRELWGRPFVAAFTLCAMAWLVSGFTIEMRLFVYANAFIFCWAGIIAGLYDQAAPPGLPRRRGLRGRLASLRPQRPATQRPSARPPSRA